MTSILFKMTLFLNKIDRYGKVDEFIDEFFSLLPSGVGADLEDLVDMLSPRFILNEILAVASGEGGKVCTFLTTLLVATLLGYISSVFDNTLFPGSADKSIGAISSSAICLVALFPAIRELFLLVETVGNILSQITKFFASLIPLLTSIAVYSGAVVGAAVSAMQMSSLASVIEMLCSELFMPLIYATVSLGEISGLGGLATERLLLMIKNLLTKGLGLLSLFVSALFTMQSLIASAKDTMSLRLAKFTAQSVAPSIGAVISASMSTLASGISYARGVVGVGAICAVVSMMVSPALPLVLYRLAVEICRSFASLFGVKAIDRALGAIQYALDGIISVLFVSVALFVLQLVLFLKVFVGLN